MEDTRRHGQGFDLSFSHMGFFVTDLARMEDFYRRVMRFTVTDRGTLPVPGGSVGLVFLSRNPEEHHQIVLATGKPADCNFNVINQISFRVASLGELRALHRVLAGEAAISDLQAITHGNAISIYFRDPEGNRIEVFFDTPWYCVQPMREPLDLTEPDEVIMARAERIASAAPQFMPRAAWVEKMRHNMAHGVNA